MKIMSYFINNRLTKFRIFNLTLLFEIMFPIISSKLFIEIVKPEKLSTMNDGFIIYFSFLWIFVSYIIGRFSNYDSRNKNNYYGLTDKSKEAVITNVIIFLLFFLTKFFGLYKPIELDNLIYLLLVFNIFALIKEILVLKILDNKFSGHFIKIFFLGEKKELVHFKKILKGSHGGESKPDVDIPRYIRLIKAGKLSLDKLITHEFTLKDINKAVKTLRDGKSSRIIVKM